MFLRGGGLPVLREEAWKFALQLIFKGLLKVKNARGDVEGVKQKNKKRRIKWNTHFNGRVDLFQRIIEGELRPQLLERVVQCDVTVSRQRLRL